MSLLESHELVSWMKDDDSSIHSISVHAFGRYALTSSNSVAQLWDLDTFSRKRTLNGAQTVGIQQVCTICFCQSILTLIVGNVIKIIIKPVKVIMIKFITTFICEIIEDIPS